MRVIQPGFGRRVPQILFAVAIACAVALSGCGKTADGGGEGGAGGAGATQEKPGEQTPPATPEEKPAETPAATDEKPADAQAAAPEPATEEPAGTGEAGAKTAVNKETLAKAYEEIYCAQKQGRTDEILGIYKKYGFESPKQWTEAWAATSEDVDWQAALTRRVQTAECK